MYRNFILTMKFLIVGFLLWGCQSADSNRHDVDDDWFMIRVGPDDENARLDHRIQGFNLHHPVLAPAAWEVIMSGGVLLWREHEIRIYSEDEITAAFSNRTFREYNVSTGARIEFLSADGQVYLWYPADLSIVHGQWRSLDGIYICLRYFAVSNESPTAQVWNEWQCNLIPVSIGRDSESVLGDSLELREDESVPYVLERHPEFTLEEYRERIDDGYDSSDGR